MTEKRIRCVVTRYSVVDDHLVETTAEEETGFHVAESATPLQALYAPGTYLYLHNSEASALVGVLLEAARRGEGWDAQAGTPPVRVECQAERWGRYTCCPGACEAGWGGRNYPKVYVSAEALLEVLT
jgi:hypothetical protein